MPLHATSSDSNSLVGGSLLMNARSNLWNSQTCPVMASQASDALPACRLSQVLGHRSFLPRLLDMLRY